MEQKKWPKILLTVVLGLALVLCLAAGGAYYYIFHVNEFYLDLQLAGAESITLEYGESYTESGAQVYLKGTKVLTEGKDVTDLLGIDSDVDVTKLGEYHVDYTVHYEDRFLDLRAGAQRTVTVEDTQFPKITLVSDPEHFTIPGERYAEEGYSAEDNYDGDITGQVTAVEENGVVTYSVRDTAGNLSTVRREIRYHDPIAPELTLKGKESMTLTEGEKFKEPGYTASDNCDGDLTEKVQVSGKVDTSKPGTYTLTYTVSDSYENTATVTRKVTVKEKPQEEVPEETKPETTKPSTGETKPEETEPEETKPSTEDVKPQVSGEKVVYLTFDDGPSKYTKQLLQVLDKYNVKATFFVVNTKYVSLLSDIAAAGHSIGIHSASHNYKEIYASEESYFEDLEKMKGIIYDRTGIETTLVRFPGGSSNTVSRFNKGIMTRLAAKLEEEGYQYFDWNVLSGDAGDTTSTEQVYKNVITGMSKRNVSVVLQHDTAGFSVDAVEKIIIWGLENGYTFKALTPSSPTAHHHINN